jgi:hypothetical protein
LYLAGFPTIVLQPGKATIIGPFPALLEHITLAHQIRYNIVGAVPASIDVAAITLPE